MKHKDKKNKETSASCLVLYNKKVAPFGATFLNVLIIN
jgi:hypothetical protein